MTLILPDQQRLNDLIVMLMRLSNDQSTKEVLDSEKYFGAFIALLNFDVSLDILAVYLGLY